MSHPELHRLISIIKTLRGPQGCPWDREQDLQSMRRFLLEESYEVLDTLDANDTEALHEELGDLLFVVLLICQIAADQQHFTLSSMSKKIADKMVLRHPHVFNEDTQRLTSKDTTRLWEREKAKRKPKKSRLDGVPRTLPALLRAFRQGEKAAAVGFDWPDHEGVFLKIEEEIAELKEAIQEKNPVAIEHELGDILLALSSLGRHLHTPPEEALRGANDRFAQRFYTMENLAQEMNIELSNASPDTLDMLWNQAKEILS